MRLRNAPYGVTRGSSNVGGWTNNIHNVITGYVDSTCCAPYYSYNATLENHIVVQDSSSRTSKIGAGFSQLNEVNRANCPACAAGTAGTHCSVNNDAAACAFGATVTGGGAHHVDAYCDGTQYVMTECK